MEISQTRHFHFLQKTKQRYPGRLKRIFKVGVAAMAEIEAHESKIYSEFAPLYDKIFGKIFYSRLEHVIEDL
jgi:hypothetical protein